MSWPHRHVSDAETIAFLGAIAVGYTVIAGIMTRVFKTWWDDDDSKIAGWFWVLVVPFQIAFKLFRLVWRAGFWIPTAIATRWRERGIMRAWVVRYGRK